MINNCISGLMNAADYYGLDELKCACSGFIQWDKMLIIIITPISLETMCCITLNTVCAFFFMKSSLILCILNDNVLTRCCITVDTVCALLATAERYIQYKCTKFLIQKVSNLTQSFHIFWVKFQGAWVCWRPRQRGSQPWIFCTPTPSQKPSHL